MKEKRTFKSRHKKIVTPTGQLQWQFLSSQVPFHVMKNAYRVKFTSSESWKYHGGLDCIKKWKIGWKKKIKKRFFDFLLKSHNCSEIQDKHSPEIKKSEQRTSFWDKFGGTNTGFNVNAEGVLINQSEKWTACFSEVYMDRMFLGCWNWCPHFVGHFKPRVQVGVSIHNI